MRLCMTQSKPVFRENSTCIGIPTCHTRQQISGGRQTHLRYGWSTISFTTKPSGSNPAKGLPSAPSGEPANKLPAA